MPGCVYMCGWEGGRVGGVGVRVGMGVFTGRRRRKVWVAGVRFLSEKYIFREGRNACKQSTTMG